MKLWWSIITSVEGLSLAHVVYPAFLSIFSLRETCSSKSELSWLHSLRIYSWVAPVSLILLLLTQPPALHLHIISHFAEVTPTQSSGNKTTHGAWRAEAGKLCITVKSELSWREDGVSMVMWGAFLVRNYRKNKEKWKKPIICGRFAE